MGERFKHIALGEEQGSVFLGEELAKGKDYSDETAREVDEEIQRITANAFQQAVDTLTEHRDAFDQLADLLIEREEVPGNEVLRLVNGDAESLEEVASTNGAPASPDDSAAGDGEEPVDQPTSDGTTEVEDESSEDR
jgi:cell division protease FtsH